MSKKEFQRFMLSLVATLAAAVTTALLTRLIPPATIPVPAAPSVPLPAKATP